MKIGNWKLEIIPIIFFLPWILFFLSYHAFSMSDFWIIKPPARDIWYLPLVLYTGYQRVFGEYYHEQAGYALFHLKLNVLIILILILPIMKRCVDIGRDLWRLMVKKKKSQPISTNLNKSQLISIIFWSFFPPILLYLISQFSTPVYHPRYFMFSTVGGLLYLIQIIETAFPQKKITPRSSFIGKNYLMIIVVISLFLITNQYNKLNLKYNAKRTISPMFQEIDRSMREGDKVYLTSELDYFLAKYYMKNDAIFIFGIPYEEIHEYVGKVLIPPGSSISSGIPTYPARAFFVYYDRYVVRSEM